MTSSERKPGNTSLAILSIAQCQDQNPSKVPFRDIDRRLEPASTLAALDVRVQESSDAKRRGRRFLRVPGWHTAANKAFTVARPKKWDVFKLGARKS